MTFPAHPTPPGRRHVDTDERPWRNAYPNTGETPAGGGWLPPPPPGQYPDAPYADPRYPEPGYSEPQHPQSQYPEQPYRSDPRYRQQPPYRPGQPPYPPEPQYRPEQIPRQYQPGHDDAPQWAQRPTSAADPPEPQHTPEPDTADLPAWQVPERVWPPPEATPTEISWATLRRQVVERLLLMNSNHAVEAHDRLHTKTALAPHGIALFYADDTTGELVLRTVTRLFFAGKEADDLPALLGVLTDVAASNVAAAEAAGQRWDPRGPDRSMVNGGDMDMPRRAVYIGVGVSTLNTPGMEWYRAAAKADSGYEVPGRCIALLADGTALRRERTRNVSLLGGAIEIFSNRTLDPHRKGARFWAGNPYDELDTSLRDTWWRLNALHEVLRDYLRREQTS